VLSYLRMRCEHDSCHCEASGGRYCSAYCANSAQDEDEGLCACGHQGCHPKPQTDSTAEAKISIGRGPGAGLLDD